MLLNLESIREIKIHVLHGFLTAGTSPFSLLPIQQGAVTAEDVLAGDQASTDSDRKSTVVAKMNRDSISLP